MSSSSHKDVSSEDIFNADSKSCPKGFSTTIRFHPFCDRAAASMARADGMNTLGGMAK